MSYKHKHSLMHSIGDDDESLHEADDCCHDAMLMRMSKKSPFFPVHEAIGLPDFSIVYEPLGGCCCNKRKFIQPIDHISFPHGAFLSTSSYHDQFGIKGGLRRHLVRPIDGMSPPHGQMLFDTSYSRDFPDTPSHSPPHHGVASTSLHYEDDLFPEKDYSIVLPAGLCTPKGSSSSGSNDAQEFHECNHCRRGFIAPPSGSSTPYGHKRSDTVFEEQYGDKGHPRDPIRLLDKIIPASRSCVKDWTNVNQTFHYCGQCRQHQFDQQVPAAILARELIPCADDPGNEALLDFYSSPAKMPKMTPSLLRRHLVSTNYHTK